MEIPHEIEEVIVRFEKSTEPYNHQSVSTALGQARTKLIDVTALGNAWAEHVAFSLQKGAEKMPPWFTYFGAMFSGTNDQGDPAFAPDVREITTEIIDHWEHRAETVTHPVLRARYADLVWDLSRQAAKRKPNVKFARIAIDSYLESAVNNLLPEDHDAVLAATRAMQLATSINDGERIDKVRAVMLSMFEERAKGDGWWRPLSKTLVHDRKAGLTPDERERLRVGWEILLALKSTPGEAKFDPYAAIIVADFLLPHYRSAGDHDNANRVAMAVSDAFVFHSENGSKMQAMS